MWVDSRPPRPDEWVPVIRVSNVGTGTGHSYNDMCPTYLFGARHYHSYIKGCDEDKDDGDKTPLAFMFAYTKMRKSFGRLTPEDESGQKMILDDYLIKRFSNEYAKNCN